MMWRYSDVPKSKKKIIQLPEFVSPFVFEMTMEADRLD